MARRRTTNSFPCGYEGCREVGRYSRRNKRDDERQWKAYGNGKYRCTRHANPAQVLTPENRVRRTVLVNTKVGFHADGWRRDHWRIRGRPENELKHGPNPPLGMFWKREGAESVSSGFAYGTGWQAHAEEFPDGTRIEVVARVWLPEEKRVTDRTRTDREFRERERKRREGLL